MQVLWICSLVKLMPRGVTHIDSWKYDIRDVVIRFLHTHCTDSRRLILLWQYQSYLQLSLTEAYALKFCHSVTMHQVTLLITDMHFRTQSLPKTRCRYEAVERYPRFGRYWNLQPSDRKVSQGSSIAPFQEIFEFVAGIFSKRVTCQCSWRAIQYKTVDHGMGHMWQSQLNDGNCKIFELKFQRAVHQSRISYSPIL